MIESNPADGARMTRWISRQLRGQNPDQIAQGEMSEAETEAALSLGPQHFDLLRAGHPETTADFAERVDAIEHGAHFAPWSADE